MYNPSINRPSISQTTIQQNKQFESIHRFAFYGSMFKQNHEKLNCVTWVKEFECKMNTFIKNEKYITQLGLQMSLTY